MGALHVNGKVI